MNYPATFLVTSVEASTDGLTVIKRTGWFDGWHFEDALRVARYSETLFPDGVSEKQLPHRYVYKVERVADSQREQVKETYKEL